MIASVAMLGSLTMSIRKRAGRFPGKLQHPQKVQTVCISLVLHFHFPDDQSMSEPESHTDGSLYTWILLPH